MGLGRFRLIDRVLSAIGAGHRRDISVLVLCELACALATLELQILFGKLDEDLPGGHRVARAHVRLPQKAVDGRGQHALNRAFEAGGRTDAVVDGEEQERSQNEDRSIHCSLETDAPGGSQAIANRRATADECG